MARRAIAVIAACLFTVPAGMQEASEADVEGAGPPAAGAVARSEAGTAYDPACAPLAARLTSTVEDHRPAWPPPSPGAGHGTAGHGHGHGAGAGHAGHGAGNASAGLRHDAGSPWRSLGVRGAEPYAPTPAEVARLLTEVPPQPVSQHDDGATAQYTVKTWVHIITDGPEHVSRQDVLDQMATLNDAYGGRTGGVDTGMRFRLEGITTTVAPEWFRDAVGTEAQMKARLRRGGPETLNLYITQLNDLILGYSTYPHAYSTQPILDGVVIDWRSMPGGSMQDFNLGYTAVHEIGHWLGLLHTFENGCTEPGDGVADTPPEARPTQGCPAGKDTCTAPGLDPIHNFMDYSHDRCMTEFTRGQADRMQAAWRTYREEKSQ